MRKLLILLPISTNVGKTNFPIDDNIVRIKQYREGFLKIFSNTDIWKQLMTHFDLQLIIIDNTTDTLSEVLLETFPKHLNIKTMLYQDNQYGSINKGSGVLDQWSHVKKDISISDWVIHFEPRQILENYDFFTSFMKNNKTQFSIWIKGKKQYYTGLFVCKSTEMIHVLDTLSPKKLADEKRNLEAEIYKLIPPTKNVLILDKVGVYRYSNGKHNVAPLKH